MAKIVVTNPMGLTEEQMERLNKLGEVKYFDSHPNSPEEWLERCKDFDIVCSWMYGLREKYSELKNVYISVPFVGVSSFADSKILEANGCTISNSPGSNSNAVTEWIIYMILLGMRNIDKYINTQQALSLPLPFPSIGLAGKNITILGEGNIGKRVGKVCQAFEMNVTFFKRGDDLLNSVKDADIVVDALSSNPSSNGLLNKAFFNSLKKGSMFISVTVDTIVDIDSMLEAIDNGTLSFVAHDVMNAKPADVTHPLYLKLKSYKNVFATPHVSAFTDVTTKIGNDMMISNIESWLLGKPVNVYK
jgi:phosphoglycerate dehydrogenase-like enzyme